MLITLDSLRADSLHGQRNGVPLMPYLVNLASQGVEFKNATTAAPWTRPSITSFLTSLYVDAHQVFLATSALPEGIETVATFLKKAGYATCALPIQPNLAPESGLPQGFDTYDYQPGLPNEATTTLALARLDVLTEPFFFFIHFKDPHLPSEAPAPYPAMMGYPPPQLDPAERPIVENFMPYLNDHVDYRMGISTTRKFAPLSATAQEAVRTLRDAEVRYADDQLRRLLDGVDGVQLRFPNTFIIVSADHGDHFWEHDYLGHALTLYEPLMHIPLVIKGPGLSPSTVDTPVGSIDVVPTIAALLGLPARPGWQGRDLFGPLDPQCPVFSRTVGIGGVYVTDLDMVRVGSTKLILNRKSGQAELYDLAADPAEKVNLASKFPEQVDRLTALLETRRQENIRARGALQQKSVSLDQNTRDQLGALGYLAP